MAELLEAVNHIRMLEAASDNYYLTRNIQADTLFILPSASAEKQNTQLLVRHFDSVRVQQVEGDHFSVMSRPAVAELWQMVEAQLHQEV